MSSYLRRVFAAFALALMVSACQSASTIPPEKLATIRSISIVNIASNDWTWEHQGFLNHPKQRQPGDDWRLGERAEKLTTALLAKQYTLIPAGKIDPASLMILLRDVGPKIGETISKLPVRPDAVLLIRKGGITTGNNVLNAPSSMAGFGVYSKTHLFQEYISAYAILEFELFDGKTFETLARFSTTYPSPRSPDGGWPFTFLTFPGEINLIPTWTDSFQEQPPASREIVRTTLTNFIDQSVPFTLRKKGLIR